MFGSLGVPELLFILVLALLIFGPKALPEVGRTLGKGLAEFRKASNDLRRTINAEVLAEELRESDPRRMVRDALSPTPAADAAVPAKAPASPEGAVSRGALAEADAAAPDESAPGADDPAAPAAPAPRADA